MSKLVINTIEGKTTAGSINVRGEGSANTNFQQGLAKAFSSINGASTAATRGTFNMSSLNDTGTGQYTITIT